MVSATLSPISPQAARVMRFAALILLGSVLLALSPYRKLSPGTPGQMTPGDCPGCSLATSPLRAARPSASTARLSELPSAGQSAISAAIGRDESDYLISATADAYHALNPVRRLAMEFDAGGAHIEAGNGFVWNPRLYAFGRDRALGYTGLGDPLGLDVNGNRVEYRFAGLTEWYVNGPLGLEQGFTLAAPPRASKEEGAVTLALDLGEHTAKVEEGGKGLTLLGEDGQEWLRYGGLSAFDAAGKELRAWMEIEGDGGLGKSSSSSVRELALNIAGGAESKILEAQRKGRSRGTKGRSSLLVRVDDMGAQYPITIDPWIQAAKLTASDGATYDSFGYSIAIDGDTIVVGAPHAQVGSIADQGAAYVFVKPASAGWATATETARLVASDGVAQDEFGSSVAINGDTIAVGAWQAKIGANVEQGAAYVYYRPATGWQGYTTESVKLYAPDGAEMEHFGMSVAVDNHVVVVGAPGAKVGANWEQGAAYMFVNPGLGTPGAGPGQPIKLIASDGAGYDYFGFSVAISGDTVVVGAYHAAVGTNTGQGAAYVFQGPASGGPGTGGSYTVTESAKLRASGGGALDWFGYSVAISGDTIVVGGRHPTVDVNYWHGAAYVFVKASNWTSTTETAKLTPSDGDANDSFGHSVAISGDKIVIGAYTANVGTNTEQGAAYLFIKPGTGWASATQTSKFTASDGAAYTWFAMPVGVSGGTVVAGSPWSTVGSNFRQGAAYVFTRAPTTTTITSVSPEPSIVGQAVTVYFSVTSGAGGTPTGNVTVSEDAGPATCTGTVAAGSCGITFNTVGSRNLTAHYAGDSSYGASDSAGATHTVQNAFQQLYLPLTIR